MRLQLLEPETYPFLLKALWGILMLLPQSPAYHTLKNRLSAVPEIGLLRLQLGQQQQHSKGSKADSSKGASASVPIDFKSLLITYDEVQAKHLRMHHQKKQQNRPGGVSREADR